MAANAAELDAVDGERVGLARLDTQGQGGFGEVLGVVKGAVQDRVEERVRTRQATAAEPPGRGQLSPR